MGGVSTLGCYFGVEFMDTSGVDTEGHYFMVMRWNSTYEKDINSAWIEVEERKHRAHETRIRERRERKIQHYTINHRQASRIPVITPL